MVRGAGLLLPWGRSPHPCPLPRGEGVLWQVVLVGRLREALRQLNPTLPEEAREEALRKVLRMATPSLVQTNRVFHKLLRDGVDVEYARPDGSTKHDKAWLVDFSDVRANDWLAVTLRVARVARVAVGFPNPRVDQPLG